MAYSLTAIASSGSVVLSDSNPYKLRTINGFDGAEIRRVMSQGPAQDGYTDLGYRLNTREIELVIGYRGTADATVDTYRDTLNGIFKPLASTPINLRYVRDDGEVRQVDCYVTGQPKISLIPDFRPGHYQEATIRLRAADPAWYEPTPGTVTVTGTAGLSANWWLAGGAIDSSYHLMHGGTVGLGSAWTYAGTLGTATSFTIALRMPQETIVPGSSKYAYAVDNDSTNSVISFGSDFYFGIDTYYFSQNGHSLGTTAMGAGTMNYIYRYNPSKEGGNTQNYLARTSDTDITDMTAIDFWDGTAAITSATRKFRVNGSYGTTSAWQGTIQLYALYSPMLSFSQINALNIYMAGAVGGTISQALAVPYEGDLPEYPTITITGPITGPTITNTATGLTLNFGTYAIGAGTSYVINTHPDYRTVLEGSTNRRNQLSDDSDLGDWRLESSPVATGGTNIISITGTNTGTATQCKIVYYNRYMGP